MVKEFCKEFLNGFLKGFLERIERIFERFFEKTVTHYQHKTFHILLLDATLTYFRSKPSTLIIFDIIVQNMVCHQLNKCFASKKVSGILKYSKAFISFVCYFSNKKEYE